MISCAAASVKFTAIELVLFVENRKKVEPGRSPTVRYSSSRIIQSAVKRDEGRIALVPVIHHSLPTKISTLPALNISFFFMLPFVLLPAKPTDASVIADFNIALASETESKSLDPPTVLAGVQAVLADPSRGRYFVARLENDNGPIIGQLMTTVEWSDWRNGPLWWVQSVYVRKDWRRRGVFRSLFQHVVEIAKAEGVPAVRLYVEEHNTAAQATYASLDMKATGYLVLERTL